MRIGVFAAQSGRLAQPAAVRAAAIAAEEVGFASLWVHDRLPATSPGDDDSVVLDPFAVLATIAAVTTTARLGTSVLVAPWYRPRLLARALQSLDVLSDGRLSIGLGLGRAASDDGDQVPPADRGARMERVLDAIDETWPSDGGRHRPPVLLAGRARASLERVARRADGWHPSGLGAADVAPMWAFVRDAAAALGRDPDALRLVVRADLDLTPAPLAGSRPPFAGAVEQVAGDIRALHDVGAHEVVLAVRNHRCLDDALDAYARVAEAVAA